MDQRIREFRANRDILEMALPIIESRKQEEKKGDFLNKKQNGRNLKFNGMNLCIIQDWFDPTFKVGSANQAELGHAQTCSDVEMHNNPSEIQESHHSPGKW